MRSIEYEPNLQLNNDNTRFKQVVKFLGLYFDQRLRFRDHIERIRQKTIKRLNLVKCISNFHWEAYRETLIRIYRAVVRSKIDYGSQIYATASNHILERLDAVHNEAIRVCTGAFKSSPVASLYVESGEPLLEYRRNQLISQHYVRMKRLPNMPVFQAILNNDDRNRFLNNISKAPLGIRINQVISNMGGDDYNVLAVLPYQVPIEPP